MPTIIDGYNLLFRVGYLSRQECASEMLEEARHKLVHLLIPRSGPSSMFLVVFDGKPIPQLADTYYPSTYVTVAFSHGETADDWIHEHLRTESHQQFFTVVSDDHGVQKSGRLFGCQVLGNLDFLERLLTGGYNSRKDDCPRMLEENEKNQADDPTLDKKLLEEFTRDGDPEELDNPRHQRTLPLNSNQGNKTTDNSGGHAAAGDRSMSPMIRKNKKGIHEIGYDHNEKPGAATPEEVIIFERLFFHNSSEKEGRKRPGPNQ